MNKLIPIRFIFIVLMFTACTLTGEQESKLNNELNSYINAFNTQNTLVLSAQTYHPVVEHFLHDSIESFDIHFNSSFDSLKIHYSNPINRETKSSENLIQRKYTVEKYNNVKEINPKYCIFALSEDKGNTWFFINEDDYFNPNITFKRLFTK